MRIRLQPNDTESGYAMALSMVLSGVSLLLLSAALSWTSGNARITQRNNEFYRNSSAAEAAADKVVAAISRDYQTEDEPTVYSRLTEYRKMVPKESESALWSNYEFTDSEQQSGAVYVDRVVAPTWGTLPAAYSSLQGTQSIYRVISNARLLDTENPNSISAVRRDIGLVSIPIFMFGIFYSMDMEFNPIDTWTVTGPVHCNGTIYVEPAKTLTFSNKVTSTKKIIHDRSPKDPIDRKASTIKYNGRRSEDVKSLNLPIDQENTPEILREIIEIPPVGEAADSALGRQRYYNQADMVILVNDSSVTATSGSYNGFSTVVPWSTVSSFLVTNVVFFDKREGVDIKTTQLDIAQLNTKIASLTTALGRQPRIFYIKDQRTQSPFTMPGIRLINGIQLPTGGLTVATPNPLYVRGNFNAPTMIIKSGGKNVTVPDPSKRFGASLVCDAFTFLSNSWNDSKSGNPLSKRTVSAVATLNAAVITGVVPSDGVYYSGGVEGTVRFLEYWGTRTMTWSGSIVVLYTSRFATAPWGASSDVYELPTRSWSWDATFVDPAKLPPGTPNLRTVVRGEWSVVEPNKTR